MTKGGITAIVVSKGLEMLLKQCMVNLERSLKRAGNCAQHRLVVVDNASELPYREETFDMTGFNLLRFDTPQSFAAANNLAAKSRPNDFYLFINNDVFLSDRAVHCMLTVLSKYPQAGICGTRLLFPDGMIQHCGVVFGKGNKGPYHFLRGKPGHIVPRTVGEYQAVTGACMLVGRPVWDALGGLDESFPFGLEDIDLCLRARQKGWRIFCANEVDSLHFESMTPGRVELDVGSRKLFMKKWRGHYSIDG